MKPAETGIPFRSGARAAALMACLALLASLPVRADALEGEKTVFLRNEVQRVAIGKIRFTRDGAGHRFAFSPDPSVFGERFLAMRPFLCLDGEKQSLCRFPYASPGKIDDMDLTDLEYEFMFLRKPRASVSVDPANGLYYELRRTPAGFTGILREVDMTPIVVPEGDRRRPIRREHLLPADPRGHWLPELVIE
jgi:hypothetical protein